MKSKSLTPTTLRFILIGMMAVIAALGVGVFVYGRDQIANFAHQAQTTNAKAQQSSFALDRLKNLKTVLAQESDTVTKTDLLVSDSKHYVYQDKIIEDITRYAKSSGLEVVTISFSDVKTATASAPAPAAAGTTPAPAAATAPANIKSRIATITLASPTDYYKLLRFIHSIEQGLFRMRISAVGISRSSAPSGGADEVASEVLTIEVFVR